MDNTAQKILTPIKAIRAKCLDCCANQAQEVRLCPCESCPLYPYRMGHNPNRKGLGGKFPAKLDEQSVEELVESGYGFGTEAVMMAIRKNKETEDE